MLRGETMVNINSIPEPFREFLGNENKQQDLREISAMSYENTETPGNNDMQDFLFLAAILMLCDD